MDVSQGTLEQTAATYRRIIANLTAPGAPFETYVHDGEHGPARLYAHAKGTLLDFYAAVETLHGASVLAIDEQGRTFTFAEIFRQARQLATILVERHSIGIGDRVGLSMRNRVEWLPAFIAVTSIGAVATLLNSRAAPAEMAAAVTRVSCRLVIADRERAARLAEGGTDVVTLIAEDIASTLPEGSVEAFPANGTITPDQPAMILFTSGTTGRSKGATHTHRSLMSMIVNLDYLRALGLHATAARIGRDPADLAAMMPVPVTLMVMPLFHISGVTNVLMSLSTGGRMVMMRRWDAVAATETICAHGVTALSGPSLVVRDLLELPEASDKLLSLSSVIMGGQASPPNLIARLRRMLPRASQGAGWGMTELAGSGTSNTGRLFDLAPDSIGLPTPTVEIRITDEDGQDVAQGDAGEILLRSGLSMQGYWDDPDLTAAAFQDGWYRTGDIGRADEHGLLYLVDRSRDMIISAGENIYCAEVEAVLASIEAYDEVAVFGVSDERYGERVVAAINARPGFIVDSEAAKSHVRAKLADYKVPTEIVDDLGAFPRNATGKIDKIALKARFQEVSAPAQNR